MLTWINSHDPLPGAFLFLDRDGVINADSPDYIKSWKEYHFYPEALKALAWLKDRGVNVIVISNQSALNRRFMTYEDFWDMHTRMIATIEEAGGNILAAFYCPHRPDEGCSCRKPSPEMILAACKLFHVSPGDCFFVGDKPSDLLAAGRAGCTGVLLDRSHRSGKMEDYSLPSNDGGTPYGQTLTEAVKALYASPPAAVPLG